MGCVSCNQNVIYKTVPEYQPSSASITIGDPFYGASVKSQQITVGKTGLDSTVLMLLGGVALGLGVLFLLTRKKKT